MFLQFCLINKLIGMNGYLFCYASGLIYLALEISQSHFAKSYLLKALKGSLI